MKYEVTIVASKILGDSYSFTCHNWSEVQDGITKYCEFKKTKAPERLIVEAMFD